MATYTAKIRHVRTIVKEYNVVVNPADFNQDLGTLVIPAAVAAEAGEAIDEQSDSITWTGAPPPISS